MNNMDKVCKWLGLELFEKFNIIRTHPSHKVDNPYYFTEEGLINRFGLFDNIHLADLICGLSKAEKLQVENIPAKNKTVVPADKIILDACCGSRMFWFDKQNPNTIYMDNRILHDTLSDGRRLDIEPDVVGDFRDMPFQDNSFYLVVFDPPHLVRAGEKSWLAMKYGTLPKTWQEDLRQGFDECMRVLKPHGTLVFKWNEDQIQLNEILKSIDYEPLFGNKRGHTYWLVFLKE